MLLPTVGMLGGEGIAFFFDLLSPWASGLLLCRPLLLLCYIFSFPLSFFFFFLKAIIGIFAFCTTTRSW